MVWCAGCADYLSISPTYGYSALPTGAPLTDFRLFTNVTVTYPATSTLSPNSFGSIVPPRVECWFMTDVGEYRNSSGQVLGARQVRCPVPACTPDQFGRSCRSPVTLVLLVNGQPTKKNARFYYIQPPTVKALTPSDGDVRSGTTFIVSGLNLVATPFATCRIDNRLSNATLVKGGGTNNLDALQCVAPPRPDLEGNSKQVVVEVSQQSASQAGLLRPLVARARLLLLVLLPAIAAALLLMRAVAVAVAVAPSLALADRDYCGADFAQRRAAHV